MSKDLRLAYSAMASFGKKIFGVLSLHVVTNDNHFFIMRTNLKSRDRFVTTFKGNQIIKFFSRLKLSSVRFINPEGKPAC